MTPKLVDFGVAPLQGTNITQAQTLLGTPHYMSPEQWRGEVADGRSDLFSLGASLPAIMQAALDPNTPVPPAEVRPGVIPPALSDAVMKALAKNPNDRYPRGIEMQKALQRACATLPGRPAPSDTPPGCTSPLGADGSASAWGLERRPHLATQRADTLRRTSRGGSRRPGPGGHRPEDITRPDHMVCRTHPPGAASGRLVRLARRQSHTEADRGHSPGCAEAVRAGHAIGVETG